MMRIWNNKEAPNEGPYAVAIGSYDGVHKGHQEIIRETSKKAEKSLLITFSPHPNQHFNKDGFRELTSLMEKLEILNGTDLTDLWILRFDDSLASLEPEEFLTMLLGQINASSVSVGRDFRFGKGRKGGIPDLEKWAKGSGASLHVFDDIEEMGQKVSSSLVREKIANGEMEEANRLLGRKYSISGNVVKGSGRGEGIGFPTANISLGEAGKFKQMPASGVYSAEVMINRKTYRAAVNYGTRKTFKETEMHLEAHVIDFKKTIYNQKVTLFLEKKIREEVEFENIEELRLQLGRDVELCRGNGGNYEY